MFLVNPRYQLLLRNLMLDGTLPCFVNLFLTARSMSPGILEMTSLLDQSALLDHAERLVAAARRAGADGADAVAVRSMSLSVDVREGAVEESERSESPTMSACASSSAGARRWSRPTTSTRMSRSSPSAPSPWPRSRPRIASPASPIAASSRRPFPISILSIPNCRPSPCWNNARARRKRRARGQGREQIGRRVGLRRHRRHGAGDERRLSRRLSRARSTACR